MGFDPPVQSDTSYEADALPPSHHGWMLTPLFQATFAFSKLKFKSLGLKHFRSKAEMCKQTVQGEQLIDLTVNEQSGFHMGIR